MIGNNSLNRILVIDDEEIVRTSFCHSLEDLGYDVLEANNGQEGLYIIEQNRPDIILTDLRMPIMNGVEFLEQCNTKMFGIPIIVISGVGSMNDVVQAIHLGAFDFLIKPIREPELLHATVSRAIDQVRLKNENQKYQFHLEKLVAERTQALNESNVALEQHKLNLETLVKERTKELEVVIESLHDAQERLVESAKMASLGRLVAGVSHELNTPLGICLTFITSLEEKINDFEKNYFAGKVSKEAFEDFLASTKESSSIVLNHLNQACELVRNFKLVSVDVSNDMKREVDLVSYFKKVISSLSAEIHQHNVHITTSINDSYTINSYPGVFSQILTNLVLNSLTHAFIKEKIGTISIDISFSGANLIIKYNDDGKGMSHSVKEKIFEPFYTTARGTGGSGLGMNIVYNLIVGNLAGEITCESTLNKGTEFVIYIPNVK